MPFQNVKLLFVCALALLPLSGVLGQEFRATVTGRVIDASQGVVPGSHVEIRNVATNEVASAVTDAQGNYTIPFLRPGEYTLTVEAPGFRRYIQEGLTFRVGQIAAVNITLDVGAVTEQVTVVADVPLLETTTSSIAKVVDNRRIMNLPLNTRNVYSLIFLTPGVTGSVGDNYNNQSYSINGARPSMMDTVIDGVSASHPTVQGFTGISVFPSVDAIEEYKVMGANYSAEYGRTHGSVLNVVYKSGTNQFHGSAYEFLRNSVLDANNFFANRLGQPLASFKRSQFGGVLAGPIRQDKTFFMVSYEGLRQRSFATTTTSVPTLLERQGNFSRTFAANGQLVQIFDPFTTRPNPSGTGFIRDAFAGNVIPPSRFDPVAANAMNYYPLPNTAGHPVTNRENYFNTGSRLLNTNNYDVRVDHNISSSQRFFARYGHRLMQNYPPVLFPQDLAIAEGRINEENRARNAVADYTNTLSPTTILTARTGFARTLYVHANQGLGFLPSTLGLPAFFDAAVDRQMFPRIGASGYVNLGGGDHRWNAFNSYTALANVTKVHGAHTLKFGFEGRMFRINNWEARAAGTFNFAPGFTQGPDPNRAGATAGNSLASLLLGTGTTGNFLYMGGWKNAATQSFYYAGYLQDDWRVTPKLTLNLGVRYDLDTPRTERFNRTNHFDPFVPSPLAQQVPGFSDLRGGLVFVGVDGRNRYQYKSDRNNLAPRFGLAYQLTSRTVLRTGYAHLFGPSLQAAHGSIGTAGFRSDNLWVSTLDGITPHHLLRNPYPDGLPPPPGAAHGLLTQAGSSIQAVLHETLTPWTMQWNFGIQQELPSQLLLEVSYVGSRGLQLMRNGEGGLSLNQLQPELMSLGSQLNQLVDNPFYGIVTTGVLAAPQVSRAQLLRPFPQFTDIIPLYSTGSSSTYHSLQSTISRRFSHGLQFDGAYTWAKHLDNGMSHQNSYDILASRALTSIDVAHRFVASYIYELPFGRGRRFGSDASALVHWLLGGWQVNGITTLQTGTPLALSASNTAGLFNPKTLPNNNGQSGKLSGPVHERLARYFDTSVFTQPAPFTFGNLSERLPDIRNDGIRNFDLSVFKEFVPVERVRVQFRAEFLNAFNTPRFGAPNTSVTSSSFGVISSQANAPRQTQFGLKFLW